MVQSHHLRLMSNLRCPLRRELEWLLIVCLLSSRYRVQSGEVHNQVEEERRGRQEVGELDFDVVVNVGIFDLLEESNSILIWKKSKEVDHRKKRWWRRRRRNRKKIEFEFERVLQKIRLRLWLLSVRVRSFRVLA